MTKDKFDHKKIEERWRKRWMNEKIYWPDDIRNGKDKFYNLWMYPYPSAEGLHAGHAFASTGSDIYGRFMRMQGKRVFQPIGYDSFGIHTENFAISIGETPQKMLSRTTKHYEEQLKSLGHGYDWTRTVTVSDIDYYRWTQWLFVELLKAGLAYRKESRVNWCPSCKTVLADEQVIAGRCERCNSEVIAKELKQWFFRITDYAEKLLDNLEKIDWSKRVVTAQKNWIGKKEGARIKFSIYKSKFNIEVFTTRPDTLYGATFMVVAPEYAKKLLKFVPAKNKKEIDKYIKTSLKKTKQEREEEQKEKSGVMMGIYAVNPVSNKKIPIFIADYVLMDYGTGAVMGVPAHDERDWEFARKYKLPIIEVIKGGNVNREAYDGAGKIINSDKWDGFQAPNDLDKIIDDLENRKIGKKDISYHLRDWIVSRQRYWGPPIPMIYCQKCAKEGKSYLTKNKSDLVHKDQSDWNHFGWYPEEKLPVKLPELKNYQPTGTGKGPLANHPEFYKTKCPNCGGNAEKETDVSDTFVDSSWYFLRYPSVGSKSANKLPFDPLITKKWLPVDLYFGGAEHSVLHLMYARFITMVLYDLKHIHFDEPFPKFFAHGLMIKDGAKMSKSRGNVVNPDEYIEKFGADTLRLYLMFMGPMDGYPDFRDTGIEGMRGFVGRVWEIYTKYKDVVLIDEKSSGEILNKMHQTIKKVTEDIQEFKYNTAIASIMEFVNLLREKAVDIKSSSAGKAKIRCAEWDQALEALVKLLAPFTPHLAEEVWVNVLGQKFSIHNSQWPKFNSELIVEEEVIIPIQVNGKLRGQVKVKKEESESKEKIIELAKKDEKIKKWIKKDIKKVIFVPGRMLNFVMD